MLSHCHISSRYHFNFWEKWKILDSNEISLPIPFSPALPLRSPLSWALSVPQCGLCLASLSGTRSVHMSESCCKLRPQHQGPWISTAVSKYFVIQNWEQGNEGTVGWESGEAWARDTKRHRGRERDRGAARNTRQSLGKNWSPQAVRERCTYSDESWGLGHWSIISSLRLVLFSLCWARSLEIWPMASFSDCTGVRLFPWFPRRALQTRPACDGHDSSGFVFSWNNGTSCSLPWPLRVPSMC